MVNRILRDDPSKGGMHNRQPVTPKLLWEALKDYDMWIIYLLGLVWMIPNTPATSYISLNLKSIGFTTFQTNLLSIPSYIIFILNLLAWTWFSERFNVRFILGAYSEAWALILLIALEVLPDGASPWARWVLNTLLIGMPYVHAIVVAITSRNAGTVRTRTVATALYNMSVQVSNIIGNNVSNSNPIIVTQLELTRPRFTAKMTNPTTALATRFSSPCLQSAWYCSLQPSTTMSGATSRTPPFGTA